MFAGHRLIENRNGLIVDMELTTADGYAERDAAIAMLGRLPKQARRRTTTTDTNPHTTTPPSRPPRPGVFQHPARAAIATLVPANVDRRRRQWASG